MIAPDFLSPAGYTKARRMAQMLCLLGKRSIRRLRLKQFAAAWLWLALQGACDQPCRALSEKICSCEPSDTLRRACLQRVSNEDSLRSTQPEDESRCADIIDGCTCALLASGDRAACGLANP